MVSLDLRGSTACRYQGKWSGFLSWCRGKNIAPCKATALQIAEFFLSLCRVIIPAIKGYRSALDHVFTLASTDLAANSVISREISHQNGVCL